MGLNSTILELKSQLTHSNDSLIDQSQQMKALKDKIDSLESHLSKETILKTQFEKDLAIERV